MSDNDKVTIWGGVPRFGTTPTTGQAIAGGGNGFVIYDSAEDNTAVVINPGKTPLPNKNMELAKKTVAGVKSQYYGFAGYLGSYYATSTQIQAGGSTETLVHFDDSQVQYETNVLGAPKTQLTAFHAGVYRISGTLSFYADEAKSSTSITITLSGSAPVSSVDAPVDPVDAAVSSEYAPAIAGQYIGLSGDPETIYINPQTTLVSGQVAYVLGQYAHVSGQTANLSGITTTANISWSDVALERYVNVWIKKNGTIIPWTGRGYKLIGNFGKVTATIDYLVNLAKDDYVEIAWFGYQVSGGGGILDTNIKLISDGVNFPSALINMALVR